jgi:hypothetical protein
MAHEYLPKKRARVLMLGEAWGSRWPSGSSSSTADGSGSRARSARAPRSRSLYPSLSLRPLWRSRAANTHRPALRAPTWDRGERGPYPRRVRTRVARHRSGRGLRCTADVAPVDRITFVARFVASGCPPASHLRGRILRIRYTPSACMPSVRPAEAQWGPTAN